MWKEAIEYASVDKNISLLNKIKTKTNNQKTLQTIEDMISEISNE
jgi:hypothetical protein